MIVYFFSFASLAINLKMGPIDMCKYPKHLLVDIFDDVLMKIRGK